MLPRLRRVCAFVAQMAAFATGAAVEMDAAAFGAEWAKTQFRSAWLTTAVCGVVKRKADATARSSLPVSRGSLSGS